MHIGPLEASSRTAVATPTLAAARPHGQNVERAIPTHGQAHAYPMLNVGYISIEAGYPAWCRWTEEASQEDRLAVYQSIRGLD